MKNENISKPITLLREDFITNILSLCNGSGLPYFAIESVLRDVIQEVHRAAQQQVESDRAFYNKSLEEASKEEDE